MSLQLLVSVPLQFGYTMNSNHMRIAIRIRKKRNSTLAKLEEEMVKPTVDILLTTARITLESGVSIISTGMLNFTTKTLYLELLPLHRVLHL